MAITKPKSITIQVNPRDAEFFDVAFKLVLKVEGELSMDKNDPGNWTGGKVGVGILKGTKYGIAASQYPHLDIKNLDIEDARQIYYEDYWKDCKCHYMKNMRLAILVFDAAVNQGQGTARKMLQRALDVDDDGVIGSTTLAAIEKTNHKILIPYFMTQRFMRYVDLQKYDIYGKGWFNRLNLMMERIKDLP